MARNGSGVYTKAVSSFPPGGTITASDHNSLWDDLVSELTNSVAADGQTTMTGPLKASSGAASAPALAFASDTNTGMYLNGADSLGFAAGGSRTLILASASASFHVPLSLSATATFQAPAIFQSGVSVSTTAVFSHPILVSGTATFTKGFIASATSTFVQPILCSGTATFTKGFIASATSTFVQPILCSGTATFTKGFIASATSSFVTGFVSDATANFTSGSVKATNTILARARVTESGGTYSLAAGSFNVDSITKNSQGDVTVTFTNALADTAYQAVACISGNDPGLVSISNQTTAAVRVVVYNSSGSSADRAFNLIVAGSI